MTVDHTPFQPPQTLRPQFTLRTMLVLVTALACVLGLTTAVGARVSLGILFLLSLIVAHVLGNSLGTKLRDRTAQREGGEPVPMPMRAPLLASARPAPPGLAERKTLHWITLVLAGGGALAGGYFGGSLLAGSYPDASGAAVALAYGSAGVLGGFAGFAVASFVSVARSAMREAHQAAQPQAPRKIREPS